MKRFFKVVLGCVCFASIILAGAENPDGSCNFFWTIGFLAAAVLSGLGYKRLEGAK